MMDQPLPFVSSLRRAPFTNLSIDQVRRPWDSGITLVKVDTLSKFIA